MLSALVALNQELIEFAAPMAASHWSDRGSALMKT